MKTALLINLFAWLAIGVLTVYALTRKRGRLYAIISWIQFLLTGIQRKFKSVESRDRRSDAAGLALMGVTLGEAGMFNRAINYCQKALTAFRQIGDEELECEVLEAIAGIYYKSRAFQRALDFANMELQLARKIRSRVHEATALTTVGDVQYSLGKPRLALELHLQALAVARAERVRSVEAVILYNISLAQYAMGNHKQALSNAHAAFEIFEAIEDRRSAEVRNRLDEWERHSGFR
jgi:tetratricopeptide (TPR) repeat protein